MTRPRTIRDVKRLRELLEKATPGPWFQDDDCNIARSARAEEK